VFAESLHSNGCAADRSEFIIALHVAQQRAINAHISKTQFYYCVRFEVSVA
jgi:hypothetical protein